MATIDPTALGAEAQHADVEIFSPLDRLLARAYALNWEHIFYAVMFVMAVLTRFVNLGDRVMSHDESLHVNYSYGLYHDGHFEHTPLMHGPLLFHMTALSFFLFGDSDFSGRIYPAVLGVIMVLMPRLLFGRWLGKLGSAVASILLLISPMVLFHNRYIREDTPSIFFTLLMVYAFFAYVDGIKPKQTRYLLLLSAAMLLSLASKEVGFMYIAVFGLFLTIFWLMQIVQGIRKGETAPIVGWIIGGVIGVMAIAGVSYELGHLTANLLAANIVVSPTLLIAAYVFLFGAIAFLLLARTDGPIHNLLAAVGDNARSLFNLTAAGLIVGTVGALGMTCILSIIEGSASIDSAVVQSHEISWIFALVGALLLVVFGTALYHFTSGRWLAAALILILIGAGLLLFVPITFSLRLIIEGAIFVGFIAILLWKRGPVRLPWGSILIVVAVGAVWCASLTYFEESTRNIENPTVTAPATNPDGTPNTNRYDDIWIYGAWVIGAAAIGGILVLRFATPFFEEMRRYPTFDLLILMGTMILPWLAAFPVYKAGYPLGDNSVTGDALVASFKALVPFVAVSLVTGLCWDPGRWIAYAATFYGLFAFFYTTMFTNANGLGTGLIGSLGYWLVQQGVRRGSQPQYYYLLVELPVYEYLPVIGASVAGVVGMLGLWRFRAARIAESAASAVPAVEGEGVPPLEDYVETPAVYETPEAVELSAPTMAYSAENRDALPPLPDAEGQWQPLVDSTAAQAEDEIPLNQDMMSGGNGDSPAFDPVYAGEATPHRVLHEIPEEEKLSRLPFLPFVGFWGAMLIMAFTMAGEKMPWLTTHLTVPLIFITGWYIGLLLAKVERPAFTKQGWILIALTPIFLIALANVIGPFLFASNNLGTSNSFGPFGGLQRDQLLQTFTWFGAVLVAGLLAYGMYWVWRRIGSTQTVRIILVGIFVLLAVLTARTAWTAAFINYDSAKEFLVYAHGGPANKLVMSQIDEIGKRTGEGNMVKVAYDSDISWPGTWYFRLYPNARFLGDNPALNDLDQNEAVVIGSHNNSKVEPVLKDKFYEFKYIRLWWPMQDYFNLTVSRVDNVFAGDTNLPEGWDLGSKLRLGLWNIWFNRDYTAYGDATNQKFDINQWPVADWMYFYVRKDVASQIWDFGTGGVQVSNLPQDPFNAVRCDACSPSKTFGEPGAAAGQLNHPRAMTFGPDGNLYVADSLNGRIQVLDAQGQFVRQIGSASTGDQGGADGTFREPWGIAVAQDGTIFVADTWNHRVEVFDKNGNFVRKWGQFEQVAGESGSGLPDGMWGPRAIAVSASGQVYLADTGNKRIRVYDRQGNFLYDIGRDPAGIQLNEPVGLAIDNTNNQLYIADTWNKRVEVVTLGPNPRELRSYTLQAWADTTQSSNRPFLALDPSGTRLYVTDPDASRVLVLDALTGKALASFTSSGGPLGGVVVDVEDHLFVADANGSHILRYDTSAIPGAQAPAQIIAPPPAQQQQQPTEAATSGAF